MQSNFSLPVNIGNPDEHTVNDFAEIIRNLVGQSFEITTSHDQDSIGTGAAKQHDWNRHDERVPLAMMC